MNNNQLNEIIKQLHCMELDEPYTKGTVYINGVVRLLKKYIEK